MILCSKILATMTLCVSLCCEARNAVGRLSTFTITIESIVSVDGSKGGAKGFLGFRPSIDETYA